MQGTDNTIDHINGRNSSNLFPLDMSFNLEISMHGIKHEKTISH